MKRLALILMATALVFSAAKADETCKAEAREHNFTGEELQTYMANCKAVAAMVCDGKAAHEKLSDEARTNFNGEMHQGRRGQVTRPRVASCYRGPLNEYQVAMSCRRDRPSSRLRLCARDEG